MERDGFNEETQKGRVSNGRTLYRMVQETEAILLEQ
jgi:hypothetical protein